MLKFLPWAILLILCSCKQTSVEEISTQYASFGLDQKGFICQITDKRTGVNYMPHDTLSPLLKLYDGQQYILPIHLQSDANKLVLTFANQSEAVISKEIKGDYIRLSLLSLSNRDKIEAVAWGPYATTLSQYIGETVGVVRDTVFAIGVQSLKINTTEGVPHLGDNVTGGFFVDPLPGQQVPDELKDQIGKQIPSIDVNKTGDLPDYVRIQRGNTAIPRSYGSDIQLFARDWRKERILESQERKQFIEAYDQDYIGTSIALFAVPSSKCLDLIEQIELGEGLPHPTIDGVWIKRYDKINPAYMLYEGKVIDNALDYADSCRFSLVHIGDIFNTWGHFELNTPRFPGGAKQIKEFTDKAKSRGIEIGVHTLTLFTSQEDSYITPIPSDSLCINGSTVLSQEIDATAQEINIESPDFFTYTGATHTVKIGKELIAYREVSKEKPYRLIGCTRGQFGTKPSSHKTGDKVDKLINNSYKGFVPDIKLQDKYAERLADVCKETGIGLMDFDGYGGSSYTGHGCFGASSFLKRWYENLDKYYISCGSGTFQYYWHIYSFMNWGEPWYDNLRESQVNYRLENQRYFERNFMPGMLGWFKLEPTYRPEDIEWIQARSAGFNAGYLLRVDESIEQNGFKSLLFESIREWQKVRSYNLLTVEQRERMKNPKKEFHLEKVGENAWNLYDVILKGGNIHKYRMVQSGEPLLSDFTFENPYEKQPIQFYATVLPGEDSNGKISHLKLEIEGGTLIDIPMELIAGYKLYSDGVNIYVCDTFWRPLAQYSLPEKTSWSKGLNSITTRCDFSSSKAPVIQFEFKALGNKEKISKNEK